MSDNKGNPTDPKTREHYEALGRFVESFELMIYQARQSCLELFRGATAPRETSALIYDNLLHIVFNHQSMTAKPILEIMRFMTAEILKHRDYRDQNNITDEEHSTFLGVLKQVHAECMDLSNTRNNLLHGTWFIDYLSGYDPTPTVGNFFVFKGNPNKDGWATLEGLPRDATALNDLSERCDTMRIWINALAECLPFRGTELRVTDRFKRQSDGAWVYVPPSR
jgi:hypothetical protein